VFFFGGKSESLMVCEYKGNAGGKKVNTATRPKNQGLLYTGSVIFNHMPYIRS
jgi:hypothetical protein